MKHYPPIQPGTHNGWSQGRNRAMQARFRASLLARAHGTCEYPDCTRTTKLEAHHDKPGYTPDCGRLLCQEHHRMVDPQARITR